MQSVWCRVRLVKEKGHQCNCYMSPTQSSEAVEDIVPVRVSFSFLPAVVTVC
jgi:hypothetical protein